MFTSVLCQHHISGICLNYLLSDNNGRPLILSDKNRGNVDNTCHQPVIARSHRLGAPREGGRPRPIIVRFFSDKARDAVYRARSGLKVYTSQNRDAPVFVNDDLTNRRAKLAFDCRKLKKEKKIADTWTYNGKVVVKDLTGKISEVGGPAALLKL